jgi:D-3-phosphoglycerate dehydrogenase
MSTYTLYLDKLNKPMEQMLIDMCPSDVELRFLEPNIGKKGRLEEAECFIDTTFRCTKEIIDSAPDLKLIQRTGVGVDMVDVAYAKQKGIPISICKGFNATSVAELTLLFILALYRHLAVVDLLTKKGEWHTWTFRHESFELFDKTVGVVGGGTIGKEVIKRVNGFGAKIIYTDVFRMSLEDEKKLNCKFVNLNELLSGSDVVTLHVPLLDETNGMIGEKQFEMMKPSAVLINTARSQLVDDKALVEALKNGQIWGAAVDIFEPSDPLFGLDIPHFISTPHLGAATYDNFYRCYKLCLENAQRIGRGEKPLSLL